MKFKYPYFTVVTRDVPTFAPEECPMCRQGIPINRTLECGGGDEEGTTDRVLKKAHRPGTCPLDGWVPTCGGCPRAGYPSGRWVRRCVVRQAHHGGMPFTPRAG